MRYSDWFGKTSSRILLGTAYFGDGISTEDAFLMMDRFRELGGTHIDTARLYAGGRAEKIVGAWILSRNASEMIVSTKGGYYEADDGEAPRLSAEEIRRDLDLSLRALRRDCIEFYWLHKDDESRPAEEIIEEMNRHVRAGKIGKFGASNWTSARIQRANAYAEANGLVGFSASQLRFNPAYCLGERSGLVGMDAESFNFYKKMDMPVVAYSSQAKGFFSKMAEIGESALSEKAKKRYLCPENMERLTVLKHLSEKYGASVAAIICAAFSSFEVPAVFAVIGGSNVKQIEDSLSGTDIRIEQSELQKIFGLDMDCAMEKRNGQ